MKGLEFFFDWEAITLPLEYLMITLIPTSQVFEKNSSIKVCLKTVHVGWLPLNTLMRLCFHWCSIETLVLVEILTSLNMNASNRVADSLGHYKLFSECFDIHWFFSNTIVWWLVNTQI